MTGDLARAGAGHAAGGTAVWLALYLALAVATVLAATIQRRAALRTAPTGGIDPDRLGTNPLGTDPLATNPLDPDRPGTNPLNPDRLDPDRLGTNPLNPDRLDTNPLGTYQLAYLHDGTRLAVLAALSALHLAGRVQVRDHLVRARRGGPDAGGAPLEEAIVQATGTSITDTPLNGTGLMAAGPVESAVDELRAELCDRGLLLRPEQRSAIRSRTRMILIVLVLGIVGLIPAGLSGASVGYLVLVLVGLGFAGWWWWRRVPPFRTLAGDDVLARLHDPDRTATGPAAAALRVAALGIGELWVIDPGFADEVLPTGVSASTSVTEVGFWNGPTHGGDIEYPPPWAYRFSGGGPIAG